MTLPGIFEFPESYFEAGSDLYPTSLIGPITLVSGIHPPPKEIGWFVILHKSIRKQWTCYVSITYSCLNYFRVVFFSALRLSAYSVPECALSIPYCDGKSWLKKFSSWLKRGDDGSRNGARHR
jgi:hypothetical protein